MVSLIRQCLELVRYMLPGALEYLSGDRNGFRVYRPAKGGRSCEHCGGYKTIIEYLYLYHSIIPKTSQVVVIAS